MKWMSSAIITARMTAPAARPVEIPRSSRIPRTKRTTDQNHVKDPKQRYPPRQEEQGFARMQVP